MVGRGRTRTGTRTRPVSYPWGAACSKRRRRTRGARAVVGVCSVCRHRLGQEWPERSSTVSPVAVNCSLKLSWCRQLFLWTFVRIKIFHVPTGKKIKYSTIGTSVYTFHKSIAACFHLLNYVIETPRFTKLMSFPIGCFSRDFHNHATRGRESRNGNG